MPAQAGISQAQRWAMQGVLDFRSGRSGVRYRIEGRGHPPKSVRARFRLAEGQESPLARVAAYTAACLAGESPVSGIGCLPE